MAIFDLPPTESTPSTDHQKVVTGDYISGPYGLRLCQIWCKSAQGWELLGKWVKYNEILFIYLFIPFFRELTYRSDPSTDFYAWWLKRRGLTQGCAFWGFRRYCCPFWGLNELKSYKKNPILGAWIGVFKPNGRNIKSFILSKLLYRFHPNFCTIWNFQYFARLAWKRLIMW